MSSMGQMGKENAIQIIQRYLATIKNEILFTNAVWMELEGTMLRKMSQAQRPIYLTYMYTSKEVIS